MLNLDFSILNWNLIQGFILKGLWFSITLTIVATLGGIFFGTILDVISALVINRIMAFIEKRARVPGLIVAGGSGGH